MDSRACPAPAARAPRRSPRRRWRERHDLAARLHARPLLDQQRTRRRRSPRPASTAAPSPAAGTRARRTGPGAGSCSRRPVAQHAAASAWSGRRRDTSRGRRRASPGTRLAGQLLGPAVGDRRQPRVQRRAQRLHERRQRIGEVAVLAAPEAVLLHHHPLAPGRGGSSQPATSAAQSAAANEPGHHGPAALVERSVEPRAAERAHPAAVARRGERAWRAARLALEQRALALDPQR